MSVCHAASIGIDEDAIEYTGPGGAHWRIPLSQVRVLGEYQSTDDDRGTLLVILFDDSGTWLQAPRNAIGADGLLQALSEYWGTAIPTERSPTPTGRVLWPRDLVNAPLFDSEAKPQRLSSTVSNWMAH